MKTRDEVENLKIEWEKDPQWEIEETEGFEDYRDELTAFRFEKEAEWQKRAETRKTEFQRNEPAFPQIETGSNYDGEYNGNIYSTGGLTKREYFAVRILQLLISNPEDFTPKGLDLVVDARQYADALIAELNK